MFRPRATRAWADGGDGSGRKVLGLILMSVRDELRRLEERA